MWKEYSKSMKFPESYISMGLGLFVVLVAGLLFYNFFNRGQITQTAKTEQPGISQEQIQELGQGQAVFPVPSTYTVQEGDTLWSIAEKFHKSGYNWISIARENNLADANIIEVGQKLKIPKVQTITLKGEQQPTTIQGQVSSISIERIMGDTYVVQEGDDLWDIAVRAYGDGYAWVKIANANKLTDPGMIHKGNKLTIPRG